jgi:hypothetical protein
MTQISTAYKTPTLRIQKDVYIVALVADTTHRNDVLYNCLNILRTLLIAVVQTNQTIKIYSTRTSRL